MRTQPPPPAKTEQPQRRAAARILVAEEDDRVGAALAALLVDEGYEVVRSNGKGMLDLALADPAFDLCYIEVMHDGHGVETYKEIVRRAPARAPSVVLMTGGACPPAARRFIEGVPGTCVEKPFDVLAETARRLALRPVL